MFSIYNIAVNMCVFFALPVTLSLALLPCVCLFNYSFVLWLGVLGYLLMVSLFRPCARCTFVRCIGYKFYWAICIDRMRTVRAQIGLDGKPIVKKGVLRIKHTKNMLICISRWFFFFFCLLLSFVSAHTQRRQFLFYKWIIGLFVVDWFIVYLVHCMMLLLVG